MAEVEHAGNQLKQRQVKDRRFSEEPPSLADTICLATLEANKARPHAKKGAARESDARESKEQSKPGYGAIGCELPSIDNRNRISLRRCSLSVSVSTPLVPAARCVTFSITCSIVLTEPL